MDAGLIAVLTDSERLLVAETEPDELGRLDEDDAVALENRIRRARNKYVGQYRRAASGAVAEHGGRGKARPQNKRAALKAEAFEAALARVSRRVSILSRQAARELRAERLAAARAGRPGGGAGRPGGGAGRSGASGEPGATGRGSRPGRGASGRGGAGGPEVSVPRQPQVADRTLRTPATEKRRASARASTARQQARRDSGRAATSRGSA